MDDKKWLEKKLDGNFTRMLRAILNKSWRQHFTKHQLYGYLPPITKTIQVRQNRHAGHCWKIRDEHLSDVLLWTPTYGRAKAGRPARTYIQQLCMDTGCSPEDLLEAMNDMMMMMMMMMMNVSTVDRTWNTRLNLLQKNKIHPAQNSILYQIVKLHSRIFGECGFIMVTSKSTLT